MKSTRLAGCRCSQTPPTAEAHLGLDELMIVNPDDGAGGAVFLGEDGAFYHVAGSAEPGHGFGALFLGEDGQLYRADLADATGATDRRGLDEHEAESSPKLGDYLLAADGSLYQVGE